MTRTKGNVPRLILKALLQRRRNTAGLAHLQILFQLNRNSDTLLTQGRPSCQDRRRLKQSVKLVRQVIVQSTTNLLWLLLSYDARLRATIVFTTTTKAAAAALRRATKTAAANFAIEVLVSTA